MSLIQSDSNLLDTINQAAQQAVPVVRDENLSLIQMMMKGDGLWFPFYYCCLLV